MKLLPFENIIYKTNLSEIEIVKRLNDSIEPSKTLRINLFGNESTKPYEGYIFEKQFKINRIIGYRNSFLPRIKGTIQTNAQGTSIHVKMRLHISVIIFLTIWCGIVGVAFFTFLSYAISNNEFHIGIPGTIGMLIFAYVLTMLGFKSESKKSKRYLFKLFENQPANTIL